MHQQVDEQLQGHLATFTCPECGGSLWQMEESVPSFACHVGHVVSGENVLRGKSDEMERSVWVIMRSLKEIQLLARQLANHAAGQGNHESASQFDAKAMVAARQLEHFEQMLLRVPE
jgi:two-component system chemotaxis response regulator CheB